VVEDGVERLGDGAVDLRHEVLDRAARQAAVERRHVVDERREARHEAVLGAPLVGERLAARRGRIVLDGDEAHAREEALDIESRPLDHRRPYLPGSEQLRRTIAPSTFTSPRARSTMSLAAST